MITCVTVVRTKACVLIFFGTFLLISTYGSLLRERNKNFALTVYVFEAL